MARVGALVFRVGDDARFIPASIALRVAAAPPVTRVPGAPPQLLGIALYEGVVVPVLSVGPARGDMVVCTCDGELVALLGGEGFETGVFETEDLSPDVLHAGRRFALLDVPGLCASVEKAAHREPWAG
jgi:hypothetical protein